MKQANEDARWAVEYGDAAAEQSVEEIDSHHLKMWSEREAAHPTLRRFVTTDGFQLRLLFPDTWVISGPDGVRLRNPVAGHTFPKIDTVFCWANIVVTVERINDTPCLRNSYRTTTEEKKIDFTKWWSK